MATEQSMTQMIMQAAIKGTKSVIMVVREADNLVNNAKPIQAMPRSSSPVLRQPTFDWKASNKYQELCSFEIETKNIFVVNNYNV